MIKLFNKPPSIHNSIMKKRGFTLIELLVVISIISLLSSVIMASVTSARMKARDVAVKQSILQLRNLIELGRNDVNNYANFKSGLWYGKIVGAASQTKCSHIGTGVTDGYRTVLPNVGTYAAEMIKICNQIVDAYPSTGIDSSYILTIYNLPAANNKYSIMGRLPSGTQFCIGSNGAQSEQPSVANDLIVIENKAGCFSDPSL